MRYLGKRSLSAVVTYKELEYQINLLKRDYPSYKEIQLRLEQYTHSYGDTTRICLVAYG